MKKKKIVSLSLIVALIAIIAGGTFAFFTDTTETKENTFTLGKVDIELTEPNWESGHIVPGRVIPKDPTITLSKDSEDSWVFMDVEMNKFTSFSKLMLLDAGWAGTDVNEGFNKFQSTVTNWFNITDKNWELMNEDEVKDTFIKALTNPEVKTVNLIFGYKEKQTAGKSVTLFDKVIIPKTVTSEMIRESNFQTGEVPLKLKITGKAIQDEAIGSLDEAYNNLYN